MRFWGCGLRAERPRASGRVSTLLEILDGKYVLIDGYERIMCAFQPFLRFWVAWPADFEVGGGVSTLLEILAPRRLRSGTWGVAEPVSTLLEILGVLLRNLDYGVLKLPFVSTLLEILAPKPCLRWPATRRLRCFNPS